MRKPVRWAFAAVMAAGMVGITVAQDQPRPRGGFGGGFGFGGPTTLLRSKTVREDLKISDDQAKKLQEWGKEYATKSQETMREKMKDIPRDQFREKMGAIMAEATADAYKQIGTILDEKQVARLKQIDVQQSGTRALSRADVQESLKISDEQKEKLRGISEDSGKALQELREEYGIRGFGPTNLDEAKQKEYDRKQAGIRKEVEDKTTAVLNDDQKAKWKELTGAPIDVAKVRDETRPQFGPGNAPPGGFQGKGKGRGKGPEPKKDNN